MQKIKEGLFSFFVKVESSSGIMLILAAIAAIICANTGELNHLYEHMLHIHLLAWLPWGDSLGLNLSLVHLINDGLMAVFFFLVGLELKREILEGELSDRRNIMLPIVGAIGGMFVPAVFYVFFNKGDQFAMRGWAIPTATDIAFALGVLALLGSKAPKSIKVFLTSLAIFDDLGAVLIIAFFYTKDIVFSALVVAVGCTVLLACINRLGVARKVPYLIVGAFLWLATLNSGVHATIAGVVLAMFIPLSSKKRPGYSLLKDLEHKLNVPVAFIILPIFAFANAGLKLTGIGANVLHSIPIGIALGLFFGKQIGVFGMCFLFVKIKIAQLPEGINWSNLYGVSILCGIGFTMSLFIGNLAFHGTGTQQLFDERIGIIAGSLMSGIVGYLVLRFVPSRKNLA